VARVRRFDVAELQKPQRLDSGFLLVDSRISRIGVQVYEDAGGGTHRELRSPEEVFSPESIKSFEQVPVTNTHPPTLLRADDAKQHAVGNVGPVRKDSDRFLAAPLMIWDKEAIAYAEAGRVEVSCGYSCDLVPESGVWQGEAYDAIQKNIRGNHVALVDSGRAGPEVRIRLDSGDAKMIASPSSTPPTPPVKEKPHMGQIVRIDGITLEVNDANAPAIQQAIEKALAAVRADGQSKFDAEKVRADKADKLAAVLKVNGLSLIGWGKGIKANLDAMKARMIDCDECKGTGRIPTGDDVDPSNWAQNAAVHIKTGAEHSNAGSVSKGKGDGKVCDYCDGKGKFRMHDKLADLVDPGTDGDAPMPVEDENELQVEQATESEAQKAHSDRQRADDRKAREALVQRAREDRAASLQRRVDRAVAYRVALEVAARQHLGPDAELGKMDAQGIKRAVIEKLCPAAVGKLDSKTREQIDARYEAELERVGADHVDAASQARAATAAGGAGGGRGPAHKADANDLPDPDAARSGMLKRNQDALAPKTEAKK
jgi:hypothetical protein